MEKTLRAVLREHYITVTQLSQDTGVSVEEISAIIDAEFTAAQIPNYKMYTSAIDRLTPKVQSSIEEGGLPTAVMVKHRKNDGVLGDHARNLEVQINDLSNQLAYAYHGIPIYKTALFKNHIGELIVSVDQCSASDDDVAELLADISVLYRMMGGSGINFEAAGIQQLTVA